MLVIGSYALAEHMKRLGRPYRTPGDLDLVCTDAERISYCDRNGVYEALRSSTDGLKKLHRDPTINNGFVEFELAEHSLSAQAYLCEPTPFKIQSYDEILKVATLPVLYSLKRSHRFSSRMWHKHMEDYHLLKELVGGVDVLEPITKMRMQEMKAKKTISLNKSVTEFFNDDVSNKTFIHDQIHEIMAHREKPMFEYMRDSVDMVKCSKEKFFELSSEERIQAVLEEAYVIALERAIIPMLFEGGKPATSDSAVRWAIMRIGTTLTSGWFRDFAVENYPSILASYDRNYVTKFLNAVDQGRIKRILKNA